MCCIEVVDPQEHPHPASELFPDRRHLMLTIGTRQEDTGLTTNRTDDDPSA